MRRILIEKQELWIVRQVRVTRLWCKACQEETDFVSLAAATLLAGSTSDQILEWIASGKFHQEENIDGVRMTCLNSLLDCDGQ